MLDLSAVAPTNGGTEKTITLRARADASVAELKGQLAAKCGLAADDLSLMCGSKPLWRDGYTLGAYGLLTGATLVATGRVRGGGCLLSKQQGCIAGMTTPVREWWARIDAGAPLAAHHFRGRYRLAALVLGPAGDASTAGADIRLLSARKLIAHIDGGGKMEIRQALEAAGKDVFLDAATVRGLLPELETKDGRAPCCALPAASFDLGVCGVCVVKGSLRHDPRCTFSGVVALSYAWVTSQDPDPQRAQLQALRPVLVWWMCERARRKLGLTIGGSHVLAKPDAAIQTADFGVFIDFMSMFQPDDNTGATPAYKKPAEQASFSSALRNIGLLYGHEGTVVFKMTETPLPPGGDPQRTYNRRGWTHLERRLGDLKAPASNSLDVAAWPTAEAERAAGKGIQRRVTPRLRESEEELAAQGDYIHSDGPGTLGVLIRDGGRGAPVSPVHFEEELKEKVFSFDSDRTVCAGLYRGVAEPLLAAVEELTFKQLAWTAAEWRHMGGALACCLKLKQLRLQDMRADDAAMAAFGGALGSGAAPALETLDLSKNEIGDEGVRHLGDALARGAAPALKTLNLRYNPASAAKEGEVEYWRSEFVRPEELLRLMLRRLPRSARQGFKARPGLGFVV